MPFNYPYFQAVDDEGKLLVGGKLYTYYNKTTDEKTTWSDSDLSTENENPIVLDARGEAIIYGSGTYTLYLTDANDAEIWTLDDQVMTPEGEQSFYVTPEDYVEDAGTGNDDSSALEQAINGSGGTIPVMLTGGKTYNITRKLVLTVTDYILEGTVPARGCQYYGSDPTGCKLAVIIYDNITNDDYMIDIDLPFETKNVIGPFSHKNLVFKSNQTGRFFKFGSEDFDDDGISNEVINSQDRAYVYNAVWEDCQFESALVDMTYTYATGVYTTPIDYDVSGAKIPNALINVWLTKAFESGFIRTSFVGADIHVRAWGCDKLYFKGTRHQKPWIALDLCESGGFEVQHIIDDFQCEGYVLFPIKSNVSLAASNVRIEFQPITSDDSPYYFVYPETAVVTANSDTLTFSATMAGKLFSDLSVITIVNSDGWKENLLVKSVSGATVTVYANNGFTTDDYCTTIPWSAAAATVYGYHGSCALIKTDHYSSDFVNGSSTLKAGSPAFLYVPIQGDLNIANWTTGANVGNNIIICGNRLTASWFTKCKLNLTNCSQFIHPEHQHPFLGMTSVGGYGGNLDSATSIEYTDRHFTPDAYNLFAVNKRWCFTPRGVSSAIDYSYRYPFVIVSGNTYNTQKIPAWLVSGITDTDYLLLTDDTLPSTGQVKITVLAKAITTGAKLRFQFVGGGTGGSTIYDYATLSTTAFTKFVWRETIPTEWSTAKVAEERGIAFHSNTDEQYLLAGVMVEEVQGLIGGATGVRPANLTSFDVGYTFYDTTITKLIVWNGSAWKKYDGSAA